MSGALRIAIVGNGLTAQLAAVRLAQALGQGETIVRVATAVRDHGLGPFGDGLVALPDWHHGAVGERLRRAPAPAHQSFSFGIAFEGFAQAGQSWLLPFGETGAPIGTVAFHQLAARLRAVGRTVRLADYSLAAMAAQAERFALPSDDPRSPLATLGFATHLSADALSSLLTKQADSAGCRSAPAPLREIEVADDRIASLTLADGSAVDADLYVDCTGDAALLIGDALHRPFESWKRWLPCDRVAVRIEQEDRLPPPYAWHSAHDRGWTTVTPLAGMRATATASVADLPDARRFENGTRRSAWHGNCVAIGASAGVIEPLFGTPLLSATRALDRLAALLPHAPQSTVEAREFNRLTSSEADRIRDIVIALYKTNCRVGEPLWDQARAMDVPDALARKLDLYNSRGIVPIDDDESFDSPDWIALFDGQGIRPRRIDPLAAAIADADILAHFARLREVLIDAVRGMPPHAAALKRIHT